MIRVKQVFQGSATKELPIMPGIYDEKDERLFGLAEYLVEHKFAETIQSETPVAVEKPKRKYTRKKTKPVKVETDEDIS